MAYMMGEVDRPQMPRVLDGYSATHKVAVNMSLHRGGSNEAIRKPRKPALSSDSLSLSLLQVGSGSRDVSVYLVPPFHLVLLTELNQSNSPSQWLYQQDSMETTTLVIQVNK